MSDFERFAVSAIILLTIFTLMFVFGRNLSWYRRHSQLGQTAIQSMVAWTWVIIFAALAFYFMGKKVISSLTYLCCFAGTMPIILLQFRFKGGALKKSMFDERDYRIGQEALQNAYLVFWILFFTVGLILHLHWSQERMELPYSIVMLILPVIAMIVSLVHAISILVLYRKDDLETVKDG
jgi:hypothetical protein